jgi:hypothetical protein
MNKLMAVVIGVMALALFGWGWSRSKPQESPPSFAGHVVATHAARPPSAGSSTRPRTGTLRLRVNSTSEQPSPAEGGTAEMPPGGGPFDNMRAKPRWTGPLPRSVDDLPRTPAVLRRIQDAGGKDAIQLKLDTMNETRECTSQSPALQPGAIGFQVEMRVDPRTGTVQGHDLVLLASILDERDDLHVLHCLNKVFSKERPISPQHVRHLDLPAGETSYTIRGQIGIPVETDGFWPWIMAAD